MQGEDAGDGRLDGNNIRTKTANPPVEPLAPDADGASDGGSSAEPATGTFTARPRRRRRGLLVAALGTLAILVICANVLAIMVVRHASAIEGTMLAGTSINDVDVSGMTPQQAIAAIEPTIDPLLDTSVTIRDGERTWSTTRRELGAVSDLEARVDEAMAAAAAADWPTIAKLRFTDHRPGPSLETTITDRPSAAVDLASEIASELDVAPTDATMEIVGRRPVIHPEKAGRRVLVFETATAIQSTVQNEGGEVTVSTVPVEPEVTTAAYDQILFLRQRDHRLDLYLNGQLTYSYGVAVGQPQYPTPTGIYEVTLKRRSPVWINPDPYGWGKDMPRRIGPGPDNPLGMRALNWSAPGAIRFHGTANVRSIGRDASHGCVRLANGDVVHLFEQVDTGAVIVSIL